MPIGSVLSFGPPRWFTTILAAAFCILLAGCPASRESAPTEGEPVALQLQRRTPQLVIQRFSNLLSFELPTDAVFLTTDPSVRIDSSRAHTGTHSLQIQAPTRAVTIRLSPLLAGRAFPDEWTLLGVYLLAERETDVTVRLVTDQAVLERPVVIAPGVWTAATVDLTELPDSPHPSKPLELILTVLTPGANLWMDDVMLMDNRRTVVESSPVARSWRVEHRGLRVNVELDDTQISFPYDRWTLEESGSMRVRFLSTLGDTQVTLYADGRSFWGGEFRPVKASAHQAIYAQQHASPGEVSIPEGMGRLDRMTPGDANNDGYNEQLGAYQIRATGARIDVRISPGGVGLLNPILEVAGLPEGPVLATLEGKLVEQVSRTPDGHVLVMIPARLERPVTLNLRVQ